MQIPGKNDARYSVREKCFVAFEPFFGKHRFQIVRFGVADDLKKLPGVSGAIEKSLNDMGIFHYWQLAELDHDTAHTIGEEVGLPGRADAWVAQAKKLTAEAE